MHKTPTFFLCHHSPYLLDPIAKLLPHHKLFRFFITTILMEKIFFNFVLHFGEQQFPSKYALGVSSSAPVLLTPTKYIWHDAYSFQPSHPQNLCPHDPPSIYSRSPKWLSFQRILHIAFMYAVPPPLHRGCRITIP